MTWTSEQWFFDESTQLLFFFEISNLTVASRTWAAYATNVEKVICGVWVKKTHNGFNDMRLSTLTLVAGLCAAFSVSTANATIMFYTNRTAFNNAATSLSYNSINQDFAANPGNPFSMSDVNGSIEFSLDGTTTYNDGNPLAPFTAGSGQQQLWDPKFALGSNDVSTAGVALNSPISGRVRGFGFDFRSFGNPTTFVNHMARLRMTDGDGTFTINHTVVTDGFVGLIATTDMTDLDLASYTVEGQSTFPVIQLAAGIDNFIVLTADAAAAIPEPSSFALMGLIGLVSLVRVRRKRRNESV